MNKVFTISEIARSIDRDPKALWHKIFKGIIYPLPRPNVARGRREYYSEAQRQKLLDALAHEPELKAALKTIWENK